MPLKIIWRCSWCRMQWIIWDTPQYVLVISPFYKLCRFLLDLQVQLKVLFIIYKAPNNTYSGNLQTYLFPVTFACPHLLFHNGYPPGPTLQTIPFDGMWGHLPLPNPPARDLDGPNPVSIQENFKICPPPHPARCLVRMGDRACGFMLLICWLLDLGFC